MGSNEFMQEGLHAKKHSIPEITGTVLADSGSLILLQKAGLLTPWLKTFSTGVTKTVWEEIQRGSHADQEEMEEARRQGLLAMLAEEPFSLKVPGHLGRGELSLLGLYERNKGSVLLVDDGPMARFCRRQSLRFISAILAPVYLHRGKVLGLSEARGYLDALKKIGRYKKEIVFFAQGFPEETLP